MVFKHWLGYYGKENVGENLTRWTTYLPTSFTFYLFIIIIIIGVINYFVINTGR